MEDPYSEKEARLHIIRVRDLIGATGDRIDIATGIQSGVSIVDIIGEVGEDGQATVEDLSDYHFDAPVSSKYLLRPNDPAPKTVKSISISSWSPPPYHLRNKGHLLYLVIVNLEGEQFHITAHVSGFYVNRSSHNKFDPSPKNGPKPSSAHSLLTLLIQIDSTFQPAFQHLIDYNSKHDPLALFQLTNALPANPWLVPADSTSLLEHRPDITRSQESFLLSGTDNNENLRDWNEEFQTTRELPLETVPEKVFRERLTSKLFADFNDAAVRGAVLVARGEIAPLNPTEGRDAQIFVHNNVFFSFGADGVGTFATEGGDEAARVATGKDVCGVRAVNQLDIPGLFTAATIIVDYLGKRIVGQSIVPGIFKQREPGDSIDYGGVEGKDIIAEKQEFVEPFAALSKAIHLKKHPVWDKEEKRHDLEASVDTKGLLGTDGRKYVLDLYRLTPLDVTWLEKYWGEAPEEREGESKKDYPHRMAVLRPELVEAYRLHRLIDTVEEGMAARKSASETNGDKAITNGHTEKDGETSEVKAEDSKKPEEEDARKADEEARREIYSKFSFTLNPDVFSGQVPQTDEEKAEMAKDEADVRAVCEYLTATTIPRLLDQIKEGEVGFPLDGESLTTLMHKRGINIRYLGTLISLCDAQKESLRLQALRQLAVQEIVSRSFKHVASQYLREVPHPLASACISHVLNCLLGTRVNNDPVPETDEALKSLYASDCTFESLTTEGVSREIIEEARKRYRFDLEEPLVESGREVQMLREVSLKLGLQLIARDYVFEETALENGSDDSHPVTNGNGVSKKKKKSKDNSSPSRIDQQSRAQVKQTFHADDIVNFVPVVKEASPKSSLAEEAFEAGRASLTQGQREIGQELLMESLTLHDQIYGILHPEVARTYLSLSNIYFSLDEKATAADLARKAVIIAERTMGLDASETILAYLNLGLFEHANGHSAIALRYVLHALALTRSTFGPSHPDAITILNNGAVMLQSLRRYTESRQWFEASFALTEKYSERNSPAFATLLFQLAQAQALDRDSRAAVSTMNESTKLYRSLLGPDHSSTKDAQQWLDSLTQNAVTAAKRQKDLASGKLRRVSFLPHQTAAKGIDAAEATKGKGLKTQPDMRDIDELIKFIDGSDAKKKKAVSSSGDSKKKTTKRRGLK